MVGIVELKKLAKERGIKSVSTMPKRKLCEVLGIEYKKNGP